MIVLINPNATASMTVGMVEAARQAMPGAPIEGWTNHKGPPAIQGAEDGALAVPPLLELVQQASNQGAGAILIGCFDDTGLAEARALAACPVIGIGQAGYHLAALAGARFSVVTTLAVSVPVLEQNIFAYHLGPYLARVRPSGVPVLRLEQDPVGALTRIRDEIRLAEAEDQIDSVVLGCGGMAALFGTDRKVGSLRIIDGVAAAAQMAGALIR